MKKTSVYLQMIVISFAATLLNAIIFYSINLSGDVLQSKDVYGAKYTYEREEIILEEGILDELPEDINEAEAFVVEQMQNLALRYENNPSYTTLEEAQAVFLVESRPYETVLAKLDYIKGYPDYVEDVAENAEELIKIPVYHEEMWLRNNIIKTQKDFYGLEQIILAPVNEAGFMTLLNYRITDFFALLLTIGAVWMLIPSKEMSVRKKNLGPIIIWLVSLCVMYICNYGMITGFIGLPMVGVSLQSLRPFMSCPHFISCGTLLVLCLVFKLAGFGVLLCVGLLCFSMKRKWAVVGMLGLVAIEAWLAFLNDKTDSISEFLREINLFSAMRIERFFLRYFNLDIAQQAVSPWPVFIFFMVLLTVMVVFATIRSMGAYKQGIRECVERAYYDELDRRYEETRKIRHDISNHLLALQLLMEKGDLSSAKAYIGEISEELDHTIMPVRTGSNVLDALIWQKISQARKYHIEIRTDIRCPVNGRNISDYHLCGIFGNILDNAMEAVAGMDHPIIHLLIGEQLDMLYISCKNAYNGELIKHGENYVTTKNLPEIHGLGISRVREIARAYDGEVNISVQDNIFLIEILLNNQ